MALQKLRQIGPGALVAAAFIGPGTVTVCTLAGANYGYALLWALVFATIATIVFQEMAGRLGTISRLGLGEALASLLGRSAFRWPLFAIILVALYAGNAAYQAGNLSGAALGVEAMLGDATDLTAPTVGGLSLLAGLALWYGSYRQVEKLLIGLVAFMACAFVGSFVASDPDLAAIGRGLVVPTLPAGSLLTVVALIGTTVVPYNLFLHASAAKARWRGAEDLAAARTDSMLSIGLGGLVSILIVSTASAGLFARGLRADSAVDMAVQLEPLFGSASRYLLGAGLLAAGFSSALTAPMATAFAVTEIFPARRLPAATLFRIISLSVLLIGAGFALSGVKPISIIVAAQFANGLLLPVIGGFLLYAVNQRALLGEHRNGWLANLLGTSVFLVSLGLGARLVLRSVGAL
ncbi:MAG: Nramp family divalent metal transporter [Pseudomonadota bacterium]